MIKKLSNNNNRLVMSQLRRTEFEHRRRTIMTQKSFGNQVNAQTPVSQIESPKSSQHFHDALGEYCVEDSPKNQVVSKFQQTQTSQADTRHAPLWQRSDLKVQVQPKDMSNHNTSYIVEEPEPATA